MLSYLTEVFHLLIRKKKQRYIEELKRRGLQIGEHVNFAGDIFLDPSHCYLIDIGDNCTFAPGARLIAHDASTKQFLGFTKFAKIKIKENCFIGDSVIVLPGVTIGPNSIVGAGSVVTKDVPPNSVSAGNPAHVIGELDSYLEHVTKQSGDKKLFDASYHVNLLTETKRKELLEAAEIGWGRII